MWSFTTPAVARASRRRALPRPHISEEARPHEFEGHLPLQGDLLGQEDDPHGAGAQHLAQAIRSQPADLALDLGRIQVRGVVLDRIPVERRFEVQVFQSIHQPFQNGRRLGLGPEAGISLGRLDEVIRGIQLTEDRNARLTGFQMTFDLAAQVLVHLAENKVLQLRLIGTRRILAHEMILWDAWRAKSVRGPLRQI